jgi:hypothetical protein
LIGMALLAIPLGYVAREARIVRDRKAVIAEVEQMQGAWLTWPNPPHYPSLFRQKLGDIFPTNQIFLMPENTPPGIVQRIRLACPGGRVGARAEIRRPTHFQTTTRLRPISLNTCHSWKSIELRERRRPLP